MSSIAGPGSDPLGCLAEVDSSGNRTGKQVDFHFNPSSLSMSSGAAGQGPFGAAGGGGGGRSHRAGSNANSGSTGTTSNPPPSQQPVTLQLKDALWFDGGFTTSVLPECFQLFDWLKPKSNGSKSSPTPPAPLVDLWLGSTRWIRGHITGLNIAFLMFNPHGDPTRAKVTNLKISADDVSAMRQNPTSGGIASYSSAVMGIGDTLQSIAYQTYGHPRLWRQLAMVNGFDDPLRLRPGTAVMLPTLNEIVKVH